MTNNTMTWEELRQVPKGTILHDTFEEGLRFIVLKYTFHLCAYLGLPKDHPLSNHDYELLPINCHGGLTFGRLGDAKPLPTGYYWYGWDYAHAGDFTFLDDDPLLNKLFSHSHDKKWLVEDVIQDSLFAIYNMRRLMKLAEEIKGGK